MIGERLLPFISNDDLYQHTEKVIVVFHAAIQDADIRLYRNVIDPFSALFSYLIRAIDSKLWFESEKARQIQKTFEDALGVFHQDILSSMPGYEKFPDVVDIVSKEKKVIAEVKNKYNTTKGNNKTTIYDDLASQLNKVAYRGFTGYYVEVIPRSPKPYDKPFTPSDNNTHKRRPENNNIRQIDGNSFYTLASGYPQALRMLYEKLPLVIRDILGKTPSMDIDGQIYDLFNRAYESEKLI